MKKLLSFLRPSEKVDIDETGKFPKRVVALGMAPRDMKGSDPLDKKSRRTWLTLKVLGFLAAIVMLLGIVLPVGSGGNSSGSSVAQRYLEAYLTGTTVNLPVAADLSTEWLAITSINLEKDDLTITFFEEIALGDFTGYVFVIEDGPSIYKATITLGEDPLSGFYLNSLPYIEPFLFTGRDLPEIAVGATPAPLPRQVETLERIDKWAEAYFSDDRRVLYEYSSTDLDLTFYGIEGFLYTSGSASIDEGHVAAHEEGVVVRIKFEIVELADPGIKKYVEMDLLITGEDTPTPDIVAWGPPGSGADLVSFGNGSLDNTLLPSLIDEDDRVTLPPTTVPDSTEPTTTTTEEPTTTVPDTTTETINELIGGE